MLAVERTKPRWDTLGIRQLRLHDRRSRKGSSRNVTPFSISKKNKKNFSRGEGARGYIHNDNKQLASP